MSEIKVLAKRLYRLLEIDIEDFIKDVNLNIDHKVLEETYNMLNEKSDLERLGKDILEEKLNKLGIKIAPELKLLKDPSITETLQMSDIVTVKQRRFAERRSDSDDRRNKKRRSS